MREGALVASGAAEQPQHDGGFQLVRAGYGVLRLDAALLLSYAPCSERRARLPTLNLQDEKVPGT